MTTDNNFKKIKKQKSKKGYIILTIIIIIFLISSSLYFIYTPEETKYYSIREVQIKWLPHDYNDYQDKEFKDGDILNVKDTITGKVLYNSTYGPITGLCFKNYVDTPIIFFQDRYNDFQIGDVYKEKFHFNYWYYNGIKYLWIDELIPWYFVILNINIRGISNIGGTLFEPDPNLDDNKLFLNFDKIQGSFNYSFINLTFNQGSELYYGEMDLPKEPHFDIMDPLHPGTSTNSYISLIDSNMDGNLSIEDTFIIEKLEPTKNKRTLDSYLIHLKGMISGQHLIFNWHKGIFDFSILNRKTEYSKETEVYKDFRPDIKFVENSITNTKFLIKDIDKKIMNSITNITFNWHDQSVFYNYYLINNSFHIKNYFPGNYNPTKDSFFWYKDENLNKKLDAGDLFIINRTIPGYLYSLKFYNKDNEYLFVLAWYPGIPRSSGNYPNYTFNKTIDFDNISNGYNITIDSIIGPQGIDFFELDFYLYENNNEINRINLNSNYFPNHSTFLKNETIEIFHFDQDGNKLVTSNDIFSIHNCKNKNDYKLVIFFHKYFCGSIEWNANRLN